VSGISIFYESLGLRIAQGSKWKEENLAVEVAYFDTPILKVEILGLRIAWDQTLKQLIELRGRNCKSLATSHEEEWQALLLS